MSKVTKGIKYPKKKTVLDAYGMSRLGIKNVS